MLLAGVEIAPESLIRRLREGQNGISHPTPIEGHISASYATPSNRRHKEEGPHR